MRRAVEIGPLPVGLANVQLEVERIWSDLNTLDLSQTAAADRLAHERRRQTVRGIQDRAALEPCVADVMSQLLHASS